MGKYVFRQHSKKNFEKIPFYSQTFLKTFLFIDNFFQKFTPFIQNLLPFLCIFLFLCLCFCFLSCFFVKIKNKIFSSDYWGIGVFASILIFGVRVPGLPPESTSMPTPFPQFSSIHDPIPLAHILVV